MKITKNDRVVIETTTNIHGCLEQGGVSGRRVSYPLNAAMAATGMSREELAYADQDDYSPNNVNYATIFEMIEYHCAGLEHVICRGHKIY